MSKELTKCMKIDLVGSFLERIPSVTEEQYILTACTCTYNSRCCSFLFCAEVGISCTKLFLKQLPHFLSGYNRPLVTCHRQASSPCCSAFLGKSSVYSQGVRGDI